MPDWRLPAVAVVGRLAHWLANGNHYHSQANAAYPPQEPFSGCKPHY
jgi:hypothetical protein